MNVETLLCHQKFKIKTRHFDILKERIFIIHIFFLQNQHLYLCPISGLESLGLAFVNYNRNVKSSSVT
jgi:hypothetical protein